MVRTGYNEAGEGIWQELGRLNKSLTELINSKYNNIFEIRIDWEGIAPTIYEVVTINDYELPNVTNLEELVTSSEAYKEESYTLGSFSKFTQALEEAKRILSDLSNSSQSNIDKAREDLVNAITELVNIEELLSIIEDANNVIESGVEYTEVTLNALKEAVESAEEVLNNENATKAEVAEAIENTKKSIDSLVIVEDKPSANKEQLKVTIDIAESISEEELLKIENKELVAKFRESLEKAKAVLENESSNQEEIDIAIDNLKSAIDGLVFVNDSKDLLTSLIEKIMKLNNENYTEETWNILSNKLEVSNKVLLNENSTDEEISKAYNELFKAFSELKLRGNKERLEILINKADGYKKDKYTKKSFDVLNEKLKEAKKILKDKNATEEHVLKAEVELQKAIDGLVLNDKNINKDDPKKDNSDKNNGGKNNSGKSNSSNSSSLPQTGGVSTLMLGGISAVLIVLGIVLRRRK